MQDARERMSTLRHFASSLSSQQGSEFVSQAYMQELNSFT